MMNNMEQDNQDVQPHTTRWIEQFTPKLVSTMREGYSLADFRSDALAGLTVAIVALPLAMAIGIASGTTPDRALVTAIVAGGLISALSGSRVQIGGPTAAFIPVVFNVIQMHGLDGLILATFIAGLILIAVGFMRLAVLIKYLPHPVIIGVTAGIAASIFITQIKELLGVHAKLPGDFLGKMQALWEALPSARVETIALALFSLVLILGIKRVLPKLPNLLFAVLMAAIVVALFRLDVDTVGTRFGGIPSNFPPLIWPRFDLERVVAVLPAAGTIALLSGIESLLSAVIADGLTGRRHRSNCELVAQGAANCMSALFGGLCATGALARTATNIRAGGRTPIAGIMHAIFLLLFMLVAAPLLSYVPLATLAAILTVVAWNIAETDEMTDILSHAPLSDRIALTATFGLTVLGDITLAIEVGVVISALFFMHRMAESVKIARILTPENRTCTDPTDAGAGGYILFRLNGPVFFGAVANIVQTLEKTAPHPRAYILDFSNVPLVDTTAVSALSNFASQAHRAGVSVIIAEAQPAVGKTFEALQGHDGVIAFTNSVAEAVTHFPAPLQKPS